MGCWNGTCGLSHLPITAGTKVRGFILKPNRYNVADDKIVGVGMTYSHDLYIPLTWSFKGEYDDYGSMENIENDLNTKAIIKYFNSSLSKGDFKHAHKAKLKNMTDVLNLILADGSKYALMMVIESVFVRTIAGFNDSLEGNTYRQSALRNNILEDLKLAKEYLHKSNLRNALGKLKVDSSEGKLTAILNSLNMTPWPRRPGSQSFEMSAAEAFSSRSREELIANDFSMMAFKDMLSHKDAPLEDMADHYAFCIIMSDARRIWMPQCGNGSQTDQYRLHRVIAEASIAHINDVKARHAEDTDLSDPEELQFHNKLF